MGRGTLTTRATLLLLLPLACDGSATPDDAVTARITVATTQIRIGALVDANGPAAANFTTAANLAETKLNAALATQGLPYSVDVIVRTYAPGQAVARAIDLVNIDDVHAIVSDVSGAANGTTGTVAVNRLNYEVPSRINHKVVVTCYQCSSAFFNDSSQTDLGFKDPDNWLFRTFFNATFESAVQVQIVHSRANLGEIGNGGGVKIAVWYDGGHVSAATTFPALMNSIYGAAPHSVELIANVATDAAGRQAELDRVYDGNNETTGNADGTPDAVYLAFLPQNAPAALASYTNYTPPMGVTKAPATANNGIRRDFLLPTLVANGGNGLEGSSVRVVANSASGVAFRNAFVAAQGQQPELTASYLFDAAMAPALAALKAAADTSLTPDNIRAQMGQINQSVGRLVGFNDLSKGVDDISKHKPINYDGASSSLDMTPAGENYPDLVHWTIQGGAFVESEAYLCDPANPNCTVLP